MNDHQIRDAFHRTILQDHHNEFTTLVVDELGLAHGKCRADIAVINGHMIGYEIKSELDTLSRLSSQVEKYNSVFDHSFIVVTNRHLNDAMLMIPEWWGIILVEQRNSKDIFFETLRRSQKNNQIDDYVVAQLLWRNEVQEILMDLGIKGECLRKKRSILYQQIVDMLAPEDLRFIVREYLKKRETWRHLLRLPLSGD